MPGRTEAPLDLTCSSRSPNGRRSSRPLLARYCARHRRCRGKLATRWWRRFGGAGSRWAEAQRARTGYEAIPLRLIEVDIGRALRLATDLGVSAYDAYMLELARQRGLPLLTLDARLRDAARTMGVELVEV